MSIFGRCQNSKVRTETQVDSGGPGGSHNGATRLVGVAQKNHRKYHPNYLDKRAVSSSWSAGALFLNFALAGEGKGKEGRWKAAYHEYGRPVILKASFCPNESRDLQLSNFLRFPG